VELKRPDDPPGSRPEGALHVGGIDGRFQLLDHHGREVTEADFRGQFVLVFFGFTHCRVVCPRNLARIDQVLERLGELASQVQPLYVTVDPARDTPAVMKSFLESSHPGFIGLTGTEEQIAAAKRSFRVYAERNQQSAADYVVPHSAMTYLLGRDGEYLAHFTDSTDEQQFGAALRAFLLDRQSP
jgi:protein SCO1